MRRRQHNARLNNEFHLIDAAFIGILIREWSIGLTFESDTYIDLVFLCDKNVWNSRPWVRKFKKSWFRLIHSVMGPSTSKQLKHYKVVTYTRRKTKPKTTLLFEIVYLFICCLYWKNSVIIVKWRINNLFKTAWYLICARIKSGPRY